MGSWNSKQKRSADFTKSSEKGSMPMAKRISHKPPVPVPGSPSAFMEPLWRIEAEAVSLNEMLVSYVEGLDRLRQYLELERRTIAGSWTGSAVTDAYEGLLMNLGRRIRAFQAFYAMKSNELVERIVEFGKDVPSGNGRFFEWLGLTKGYVLESILRVSRVLEEGAEAYIRVSSEAMLMYERNAQALAQLRLSRRGLNWNSVIYPLLIALQTVSVVLFLV